VIFSALRRLIKVTFMSSQIPPVIKNLIIDMDGVLWRGETAMPGLVQFFETLQAKKINFVMATNNATKTAVMYGDKLARFGIPIDPSRILTVAEATAGYLGERYPPGTAVYVAGAKGLLDAHLEQGFRIISLSRLEMGRRPMSSWAAFISISPMRAWRWALSWLKEVRNSWPQIWIQPILQN
jgi:hypothetical protein